MLVNPVVLLTDVVESFRPRFQSKQILLYFQPLQQKTVSLLADSTRLSQLFTNVLENSFRYTDNGGEVSIAIQLERKFVVFTFDDSHPGVTGEAISHLFERLYRVDSLRTRDTGGVGLGLSICNNIVMAHQSTISADHSKRGGITILIKLPIAKAGAR